MTTAELAHSFPHVRRVALVVNDLDALVSFYGDVVGLTVHSRSHDAATLGAGETPFLELHANPDAPERTRQEAGLFHTAFRVPTRRALGDALDRIRTHWTLSGASDHLVSEALYLTDPEGNGVEIYCDRSFEDWQLAEDGSVEMATLPLDLDDLGHESSEADAVPSETDAVPSETDVGHVHLEVTDISASSTFYVDLLGLRVRQQFDDSALFVAASEYHHHVGLNTWNGRSDPVTGRGLDWFELVVPETLDAVRGRLVDGGLSVEPVADGLVVTDPDGVTVRVVR